MFEDFGVPEDIETLYERLLPSRPVSVESFSGDLPGTLTISETLAAFREFRLADELADGRWQAAPREIAIDRLAERQQSKIDERRKAARSKAAELEANVVGRSTLIRGAASIIRLVTDLCDQAQFSIDAFDRPPYIEHREPTLESLQKAPEYRALQRGVRVRGVYHPGFLNDPNRYAGLQMFLAAGEESVTAPVGAKLMIFDRKIAYVSDLDTYGGAPEDMVAARFEGGLIVQMLNSQFKTSWEDGDPITLDDAGEVVADPENVALGAVLDLAKGAQKSVLARRMGKDYRTIQRYVAQIRDEHHAAHELNLGWILRGLDIFGRSSPENGARVPIRSNNVRRPE